MDHHQSSGDQTQNLSQGVQYNIGYGQKKTIQTIDKIIKTLEEWLDTLDENKASEYGSSLNDLTMMLLPRTADVVPRDKDAVVTKLVKLFTQYCESLNIHE